MTSLQHITRDKQDRLAEEVVRTVTARNNELGALLSAGMHTCHTEFDVRQLLKTSPLSPEEIVELWTAMHEICPEVAVEAIADSGMKFGPQAH